MKNLKLGVSGLTGKVYLYRHGKDQNVALEKQEVTASVLECFIQHALHGAERGAVLIIGTPDQEYRVTVEPAPHPQGERP